MSQFAVVSVAPAEHFPFTRECQCVTVRALGRGNLFDGTVRLKGQLLQRGLVVGVTQTQAAVASFSTSPNRTVRGDDERAILTSFDLELHNKHNQSSLVRL